MIVLFLGDRFVNRVVRFFGVLLCFGLCMPLCISPVMAEESVNKSMNSSMHKVSRVSRHKVMRRRAAITDNRFVFDGNVLKGLTAAGRVYFGSHHDLVVPDGVVGIGDGVFKQLGLSSVVLPASVRNIGDYAFYDNSIASLTVPSGCSVGKRAFQKNEIAGKLVLNDVESVGEGAFADNNIGELVVVDDRPVSYRGVRLSVVSRDAFRDNVISSVSLPGSVSVLGDACFANNRLKSFVFHDGIRVIGDEVFSGNGFSEVSFPSSLKSFGRDVFANNKRWVRVVSGPGVVRDEKYSSGFGVVRNAVSVRLRCVDESGVDIVSPRVFYSEFFEPDGIYYLGAENVMDAPVFAGYVLQRVNGSDYSGGKVRFTPDRDGYEVVLTYKREDLRPIISGELRKNFAVNEQVTKDKLL